MRLKEFSVSSSKSIQFGEFKASCSFVVEVIDEDIKDVRQVLDFYQREADDAVVRHLQHQQQAKAQRSNKNGG